VTVRVTPRQLAAYNHFRARGLTENGAAAPPGNGCQESGESLDSTVFRAHPDYSGGVAQAEKSGGFLEWLGSRKDAYIAFSRASEARLHLPLGTLLNDLMTQCDFTVYELQTDPQYATLYEWLTTGNRSIATLTADFMQVYERPAIATANLGNRIAHAEAIVATAKKLAASASPAQPAPQAPVPQAPAPQAPPPVSPLPTASAGLPPISEAEAALDEAVRDNIGALKNVLLAQRAAFNAAIDKRIAKLETASADFGGNDFSPVLQKSDAGQETATPKRKQTVLGITNWKTAIAGIVAGSMGVANVIPAFKPYADLIQTIGLIAAGLVGVAAKDGDVTGGTVPATKEAEKRVGA
jgi:Phage tail lysozyme